jgi:hypothetical protein
MDELAILFVIIVVGNPDHVSPGFFLLEHLRLERKEP